MRFDSDGGCSLRVGMYGVSRMRTLKVLCYTAVAIVLHWAIAAAILSNLLIGWWMKAAIGEVETQARAIAAFQLHKSIGLTVLLLTLGTGHSADHAQRYPDDAHDVLPRYEVLPYISYCTVNGKSGDTWRC